MKIPDIVQTGVAITVALTLAGHNATDASANEPYDASSPRLANLARELSGGNREALATFWKEARGKTPLVETIAGDKHHRRVTFL